MLLPRDLDSFSPFTPNLLPRFLYSTRLFLSAVRAEHMVP